MSIFKKLFPSYSKWEIVEVFYFSASWYVIQVRQNLDSGYKQFKTKKIVNYHYGTSTKINVENINNIINEKI